MDQGFLATSRVFFFFVKCTLVRTKQEEVGGAKFNLATPTYVTVASSVR